MRKASLMGRLALVVTPVLALAMTPIGATSLPGVWDRTGGDAGDTRYSALTQINATNIDQLGLAWEFRDFIVRGRTHRGMESNPVLIDGVLYVSGPWGNVHAIDARTGALKWAFDSEADGQYARYTCCDVVNRGLAVAGGRVFVASLDGFLFALDMKTGKPVWKVDTFPTRKWSTTITGAPQIAGNKVLIGNAGADMGSRGYVSAYDIATGKLAWRFWAVPGDPADGPDETPEVTLARKTWPADARFDMGLGGNSWEGLAYDAETDTAYLGLGNGGPQPVARRSRSGALGYDHLFLTCIVAVDAATGRMKWYYQTTPGDSWDYAAASPFILTDLVIGGRQRKVIMQAPKNGMFYVLDRVSGELLRADPYTVVTWNKGIDRKTGRPIPAPEADFSQGPKIMWPSMAGGHAWAPMSFSPKTGLVYLPVMEAPARMEMAPVAPFRQGTRNALNLAQFPPFNNPGDAELMKGQPTPRVEGRLKAWDPVSGQVRWQSGPLPFITGGTLVSGDLVFHGSSDGHLYVYDAASGKELRRIFIGTAIMAAPITYTLDGVQYVAVTAGAGGAQGGRFGSGHVAATRENYERLLVFRLGGKAVDLPPLRSETLAELPHPIPASAATLARGGQLFREHCQRCHAMGGGASNYPNLWNMNPATIDALEAIVGDGAFRYAGMGSFSDLLTRDEIGAVKAFIVNDSVVKRQGGSGAGAHNTISDH